MNKIITFIISGFILLGFIACESEMEVKNYDKITPRLVVNTILRADADTNRVYLSRSRSVFTPQYRYRQDGYGMEYIGDYDHLKDADVMLDINGNWYDMPYHKKDSSYIFEEKLKEGDRVRLRITQGNDEVESAVIIPATPQVISIDTFTFYRNTAWYVTDYLRFHVKIKDEPGKRNFYRLKVNYRPLFYGGEYWTAGFFNGIYSEDPVILNGFGNDMHNAIDEFFDYPRNDFRIFTDDFFDGQEYTLDFYTEKIASGVYTYDAKLYIYLEAISEDLYNYYYSLLKYMYSDETLNEPVLIYNNIKGGLGIAGAANEVILMELEDEVEEGEPWYWY